jgi:peptide/nickel transport system permease protein
MLAFLLKRKRFLFSFLFLISLFIWSILHGDEIRDVRFETDEQGNILSRPPYPPFTVFLLGSDQYGNDLGGMMLVGAKWTIGITFLVAIVRLLLSLILSMFVFSLPQKLYEMMKSIFEPFSVVPQTIIAYFILHSVLWMPLRGFEHPFWERAVFQTFILIIIAIPNLTIHLAAEMRQVSKEPFIEPTKILGASKAYIFFKHIIPHVYEKWILLFGQQFLQTLLVLAHLGFLELFFGGTNVPYRSAVPEPPRSVSYEWSGVIGINTIYLNIHQWIILVPMIFFIMTSISAAFINGSIKAYIQKRTMIEK